MIQKQENYKSKNTHNTKSILLGFVAFFVFFLLLSSVFSLSKKYFAIRANIKELRDQELRLKEKKVSVTNANDFLETTEGKEQIFRNTYRLVKPGEGIVVITKEESKTQSTRKKPNIEIFWDSILRGLRLK